MYLKMKCKNVFLSKAAPHLSNLLSFSQLIIIIWTVVKRHIKRQQFFLIVG